MQHPPLLWISAWMERIFLNQLAREQNQVWNENRAALMHWGKDYKQETWLIYDDEEFIINKGIPQNLELFTLTTNWFWLGR